MSVYLNQLENRSNKLNYCDQQRSKAHRAEMITNQMCETYQYWKAQLALIAREKPFRDGTADDKILTSEKKLCKPNKAEHVDPSSRLHCTVFYITDLEIVFKL